MEQSVPNLELYPQRGIRLFSEQNQLSQIKDIELEFFRTPYVSVGTFGEASIEMTRANEADPMDERPAFELSQNGVVSSNRYDAEKKGKYELQVDVKNSNLPEGFAMKCKLWSKEYGFIVESMTTKLNDSVNKKPHNTFTFSSWSPPYIGKSQLFYVPNDRDLLRSLECSFETIIDANPQGGDN